MSHPASDFRNLIIHTSRLTLRPPDQRDLSFMTALFAKPELVAHRPDPTPDSRVVTKARLAREISHWRKFGFGRWAAEADGELIGFGGVTQSEHYDALNLSYHLDPAFWRRGYAVELARAAVSYGTVHLRRSRIVGLVRPVNGASRRVLEKCGFVQEGMVELHGAPTMLFSLRTDVLGR
ncbi:GNAT family N-acetyltransferase [Rhizobium sp. NRK18]|uniref:GNAT family N-acetyltransferase n=1 Tax=Rhizobium sp. NRK18 TaxID=2964667 RepID=UPI0021C48BE7|nr:GNAT family N-acetyltransferase [Rhizobium sp. NRK18]MCQ2003777.1 GNAT family N-acetyltransferase [Rhizobium sp. NRK18]